MLCGSQNFIISYSLFDVLHLKKKIRNKEQKMKKLRILSLMFCVSKILHHFLFLNSCFGLKEESKKLK